jgi:hypothetical protein
MPESSGAFSTFLRSMNEAAPTSDKAYDDWAIEHLFARTIDSAHVLDTIMQLPEDENDIGKVRDRILTQASAQWELVRELEQLHSALETLEPNDTLHLLTIRINHLRTLLVHSRNMNEEKFRFFREELLSAYELYKQYISTRQSVPKED